MFPFLARQFFRLQERMLGRRTFAILRELRRSEQWPRERLKRFQLGRLQDVVTKAYQHTPYWRSVMEQAGFAPDDVRSLSDLRRFPLLDKETVRARREEMVWRDEGPRLQLVRTSGSTNEALQFYTNSNREAQINAARMRGHEWVGIRRGDREMYFWGSPVELSKQDRLKRIRDWLINDGLTNGFHITPERVPQYVDYWKRWRPKCIFGYPCSFMLVVTMARSEGIDLGELAGRGLKSIITTSEMLTDVDRNTIAAAFGVPVYDSFGLREIGLVGHECERQTMHCVDEQLILETIDPTTLEPTDGEGELVVTNVMGPAMPIFRYRTGDVVTLSDAPCACGRSLSQVKISGGRVAEFVVTTDGTWIPGYAFIYICRAVEGIVKFQVVQERRGELRVRLATDASFPADGARQVQSAVEKRLASDDKIVVEIVDDVQPAPSGKYRPVVGKLAERLLQEQQRPEGAAAATSPVAENRASAS
ncbi:MAG: phenylacetate--CoA ligase family protein [Planctomycetota bacterium]|jgi:phenylacetate-CoA ligase